MTLENFSLLGFWMHLSFSIIASVTIADVSIALPITDQEKRVKMKPASELISVQDKGKVFPTVLGKSLREPSSVIISLSKQRAYLMVGNEIALDSPISSGRRNGWTPKGKFVILEKDLSHYSSLYGEFIDTSGHTVRSGVSSRIDVAPSGTHFHGAPMKYFLRLTSQGIGIHAGICPGYPASHGCIRLPIGMAEILYQHVSVQTPVIVED